MNRTFSRRALLAAAALALALLYFYGLDQLVMAAQGLPLHADLSPAH